MQPYTTETFHVDHGSHPSSRFPLPTKSSGSATSFITIRQPEKGYRFSEDPFLLADHVFQYISGHVSAPPPLNNPPSITDQCKQSFASPLQILDVGTGSGIISLLIAAKFPRDAVHITAVEIQKDLAELAQKNILTNDMAHRITLLNEDVRTLHASSIVDTGKFDAVISNPPYIKRNCGRLNPDSQRAVARHELFLSLDELIRCATTLLTANGLFFLIYPTKRMDELITAMRHHRIEPVTLRYVHTRPGADAKLFLITGIINGQKETISILPSLHLERAY